MTDQPMITVPTALYEQLINTISSQAITIERLTVPVITNVITPSGEFPPFKKSTRQPNVMPEIGGEYGAEYDPC